MTAPAVDRINPTIPGQLALLPTTPGSIVRASAAHSPHPRGWTLAAHGRWCEPFGQPRSAGQLRDVEVLYVAPAPAAKREVAS